jgi:hypothetical protein
MEKSHNWVYVRSKNNGKNRSGDSKAGDASLPTPQTFNHRTPDGSNSPDEAAPAEDYDFSDYNQVMFDPAIYVAPRYPEYICDGPFISPVESHSQEGQSMSSSENTSPFLDGSSQGLRTDSVHVLDPNFSGGADFPLFEDIYSAPVSIFQPAVDIGTLMGPVQVKADPIPHISPGGHGNTMLYTPTSLDAVDDSFEHLEQDKAQLGSDFQLFSNAGESIFGGSHQQHGNPLFGEIPSTVAGFSQPNTQEFFQSFYAPHHPIRAEWLQSDEGYSGGFDSQ